MDKVVANGPTIIVSLIQGVRNADEYPDTAEDGPSGIAVVALKDAAE